MRPEIRSQIMHIPTGLYLAYCYYPGHNNIHLVLSEKPSDWVRKEDDIFYRYVSNPSWDSYVIHIGNTAYNGTCDEFVLVEREI